MSPFSRPELRAASQAFAALLIYRHLIGSPLQVNCPWKQKVGAKCLPERSFRHGECAGAARTTWPFFHTTRVSPGGPVYARECLFWNGLHPGHDELPPHPGALAG